MVHGGRRPSVSRRSTPRLPAGSNGRSRWVQDDADVRPRRCRWTPRRSGSRATSRHGDGLVNASPSRPPHSTIASVAPAASCRHYQQPIRPMRSPVAGSQASALGLSTVCCSSGCCHGCGRGSRSTASTSPARSRPSLTSRLAIGAGSHRRERLRSRVASCASSVASGADIIVGGTFATALASRPRQSTGTRRRLHDGDCRPLPAPTPRSVACCGDGCCHGARVVAGSSTSTVVDTALPLLAGTRPSRPRARPTPQTFTAGQFTVQVGTGPAVDLAGTYQTVAGPRRCDQQQGRWRLRLGRHRRRAEDLLG